MTNSSSAKTECFAVNPEHYRSFRAELFRLLDENSTPKEQYLREELESKLLDPEYSDDATVRRDRAITKWLDTEIRNRDTNTRLLMSDPEVDLPLFYIGDKSISGDDVLGVARSFLCSLLTDEIPWDELVGAFSGGASTSIKREVGAVPMKYQQGMDISEGAVAAFRILNGESVHWYPAELNFVPGNEMFTVPKTTLIDRVAAKEPDLNMYVQKAVGGYIRKRLRGVGIDLNDQSVNQRLAYEGSVSRETATVDLSSASDSVSTQLVYRLVPEVWFMLMDDIRSKVTLVGDEWHGNHMFSSMGNAFTFELESAIFWALSKAVAVLTSTKGVISVYGDDIIIPIGMRFEFLAVFRWCGFTVNPKKTFFEGSFRESCGKHYLDGVDITPFYVREIPQNVSDWCHLLNSLRRWCQIASDGILDPKYFDLWSKYSALVPKPLHGGSDWNRRDYLASYSCRGPRAVIRNKQTENQRKRDELQLGAYLQWLDTAEHRRETDSMDARLVDRNRRFEASRFCAWSSLSGGPRFSSANTEDEQLRLHGLVPSLRTNTFEEEIEGVLVWRRAKASWLRHDSYFPQEVTGA